MGKNNYIKMVEAQLKGNKLVVFNFTTLWGISVFELKFFRQLPPFSFSFDVFELKFFRQHPPFSFSFDVLFFCYGG
jgi:hypothetical protein